MNINENIFNFLIYCFRQISTIGHILRSTMLEFAIGNHRSLEKPTQFPKKSNGFPVKLIPSLKSLPCFPKSLPCVPNSSLPCFPKSLPGFLNSLASFSKSLPGFSKRENFLVSMICIISIVGPFVGLLVFHKIQKVVKFYFQRSTFELIYIYIYMYACTCSAAALSLSLEALSLLLRPLSLSLANRHTEIRGIYCILIYI